MIHEARIGAVFQHEFERNAVKALRGLEFWMEIFHSLYECFPKALICRLIVQRFLGSVRASGLGLRPPGFLGRLLLRLLLMFGRSVSIRRPCGAIVTVGGRARFVARVFAFIFMAHIRCSA